MRAEMLGAVSRLRARDTDGKGYLTGAEMSGTAGIGYSVESPTVVEHAPQQ